MVIASSGAPSVDWGTGPSPLAVVCGTQQILANEFALYMCQFNDIAEGFIYTGGLTYRYIAFGY
jgi:hypothetical protein